MYSAVERGGGKITEAPGRAGANVQEKYSSAAGDIARSKTGTRQPGGRAHLSRNSGLRKRITRAISISNRTRKTLWGTSNQIPKRRSERALRKNFDGFRNTKRERKARKCTDQNSLRKHRRGEKYNEVS